MTLNATDYINRGFEIIRPVLAEFICRKLMREVRIKIDGPGEKTVVIKTARPAPVPQINYARNQ